MENLWERFDDVSLPEDVMEAKAQFAPVAEGTYNMRLEEISAGESNSGMPMLKARLRLVETNRVLFYNKVLQVLGHDWLTDRNIAEALVFVGGIIGEDLDFMELGGLKSFGALVNKIEVGDEVYSIRVGYGKNDKDKAFPELTIELKVDEVVNEFTPTDDDVPF